MNAFKLPNFKVFALKDGSVACWSAYDAEFIASAKALGAKLIRTPDCARKGWQAPAGNAEDFRAAAEKAASRHAPTKVAPASPAAASHRWIGGEESYGGDWQRNGRGHWVC